MSTNQLPIKDRVKAGKVEEANIIRTLNNKVDGANPLRLANFTITGFLPASKREDTERKIDAWATLIGRGPREASVQIKYRESGQDLGLSLVRPYHGVLKLAEQWEEGKVPWDRDVRTPVDLYVVKVPNMGIVVVPAAPVHEAAISLLEEMAEEPEFCGTVFRSDPEGIELRITVDKGAGYTQGQRKVIAYMTPRFLVKRGGVVIQDV